jgi:hypothetical protein
MADNKCRKVVLKQAKVKKLKMNFFVPRLTADLMVPENKK